MKVGDYVRTKSYGIKKINGFSSTLEEDFIDCDYDKYQRVLINKKEIIKSSPNIIDLIEVGDYVNGCRIQELVTGLNGEIYLETELTEFDNVYACGNINIYEKDIKSIVTKESFKSMEYKVGE